MPHPESPDPPDLRKQPRERVERAFLGATDIQLALLLCLEELRITAPKEYSVFALRYFQGIHPPQIAMLLGIRRAAVDQNLSRARKKLRTLLVRYPEVRTWLGAAGPASGSLGSFEDPGTE